MLSNVAAHKLKDHHYFSTTPAAVDDAIGEMLALQYEELLDSQAVLERRLQATVDGMADGQRQAATVMRRRQGGGACPRTGILRVRQDWRDRAA